MFALFPGGAAREKLNDSHSSCVEREASLSEREAAVGGFSSAAAIKEVFCVNLGTDSSKLLLTTREKRDRGLQSQNCLGGPRGEETPAAPHRAAKKRHFNRRRSLCSQQPHQKQGLSRKESPSAAFLSHGVSFLPPQTRIRAAAGAGWRQGSRTKGQRCPRDASQVPAPSACSRWTRSSCH